MVDSDNIQIHLNMNIGILNDTIYEMFTGLSKFNLLDLRTIPIDIEIAFSIFFKLETFKCCRAQRICTNGKTLLHHRIEHLVVNNDLAGNFIAVALKLTLNLNHSGLSKCRFINLVPNYRHISIHTVRKNYICTGLQITGIERIADKCMLIR